MGADKNVYTCTYIDIYIALMSIIKPLFTKIRKLGESVLDPFVHIIVS